MRKNTTSVLAILAVGLGTWYAGAVMAMHGMKWTDWQWPIWVLFCGGLGYAVGTWIRKRHAR